MARKQYSADFKTKVALEAIKGQKTINEIASTYELHPTQITQWKKRESSHFCVSQAESPARNDSIFDLHKILNSLE
ncbi:MAG: hypothetical protein RLZZ511_4248, partial [Cyanobacteriota bacterium]